MSREYKTRFGYDFLPFHNAISMTEWTPQSRRSWECGSPFVVRYAGSIVEDAQRDALRDVCRAVAALRSRGEAAEMWIHAPLNQSAYLRHESFDGVTLIGVPDSSSIIELLSSADLLVLPFNFDTRSAEYMKLSMPTKVPAYMASGTPILVYGPKNSAVSYYAREEKWAWVVSEPDLNLLQSAIGRLKSDVKLREDYGRRAQQVAAKHHDAAVIRPAFQRLLAGLVSSPVRQV
jgi:glycosyltransferase involved in cell wall biosynthesis